MNLRVESKQVDIWMQIVEPVKVFIVSPNDFAAFYFSLERDGNRIWEEEQKFSGLPKNSYPISVPMDQVMQGVILRVYICTKEGQMYKQEVDAKTLIAGQLLNQWSLHKSL